MAYICLKACVLGGVQYGQGDSVPEEAVLPTRATALQRMGYLAEQTPQTGYVEMETTPDTEMEGIPDTPILVPVVFSDGSADLPMWPEDIRTVFCILQKNAEDASKAIAAVEREETLMLLHAADSRKTVKAAAAARAKALGFAREEAETGDG